MTMLVWGGCSSVVERSLWRGIKHSPCKGGVKIRRWTFVDSFGLITWWFTSKVLWWTFIILWTIYKYSCLIRTFEPLHQRFKIVRWRGGWLIGCVRLVVIVLGSTCLHFSRMAESEQNQIRRNVNNLHKQSYVTNRNSYTRDSTIRIEGLK